MNGLKLIFIVLVLFLTEESCKKAPVFNDPVPTVQKNTHHPFLIVRKEQFPALRAKANTEPWASMKADAVQRSSGGSQSKPYDLQYYIGALALAYILDEDNSATYAERVRKTIVEQYAQLEVKDGGSWGGVVPPMSSFFAAILALDIVHDGLSEADVLACENVIRNQIFKIAREGSWADARRGTHGTWDIYKGDRTTPDEAYYAGIMQQITEDGVSPVTNHYAWERVGGGNSRLSKSGYMDVLEFTGIDQRYYNNERLQKFQRWLFGSSVNCAKEMAIFGDMLPTQGIANDMLHRRIVNFDAEAAGYAAWFHQGRPAIGHILTYLLPQGPLPDPVIPSSKLYENGGAFFRQPVDDPMGLHAVLYNIQSQDEWHTHQEVNGLALSGLGNRLLVNGGRLGAPTRAASLNNTLTINGEEHASRIGGGIVEGFTGPGLDYASGSSGGALGSAVHSRNLILLHETESANGYFMILDEVKAASGEPIKIYLHPANQSSITTVQDRNEYDAAIDHHPSVAGTKLSVFYATPPLSVKIDQVPSAVPDRYPDYPDHHRLESVYATDSEGYLQALCLLFPHRNGYPKAKVERILTGGMTGAQIDHGAAVTDLILEGAIDQVHEFGDTRFRGKALIVRQQGETHGFYFLRHGTLFERGNVRFQADEPVSLYVKGNQGIITSAGTKMTLTGPKINNPRFGPEVEVLNSGAGFVEIRIPGGVVRF